MSIGTDGFNQFLWRIVAQHVCECRIDENEPAIGCFSEHAVQRILKDAAVFSFCLSQRFL
jgi:hypothetical protein